ncbi:MAG: glycosyltransferase family 4 protein [Bacteroidales bacterium]|nr:glycosyltransferase family 4 protein [Bacteroidales bacterium]
MRIFHKECRSLATAYRVYLVVADGKGDQVLDGVNIIDAGLRDSSLLKRIINTVLRAYRKSIELDCEIYHIHDPELLIAGYLLRQRGKKVIYDVHEDLPRQIKRKKHISSIIRPVIPALADWAERIFSRRLSAIVAATPFIANRFRMYNKNVVIACNYALMTEFGVPPPYNGRADNLCYVGGLTGARGLREIIKALEEAGDDVRLNLAGSFESTAFENEIMRMKGWAKVNFFGHADRKTVENILHNSRAGLVTLHPGPGYPESLPVKLFEYMAAALPVIASDFPLWKEIIGESNCGLCVNPQNPSEISEAIIWLLRNPARAQEMGQNGLKAVQLHYNWGTQEKVLFSLYKTILD